jgi:phosphoribosylformylglycinamidine synthase
MDKNTVTLKDALDHKLSEEEFNEIQRILGRLPNPTELGIFSAMWSEHCSYKNSILQLKTLPTDSDRMLAKAGEENAGAMDIGDGLGVVFKIESHNHPTAIEPYQGAATGVGGIMRDIFTMGARPFVSLNSLRFGNPDDAKNRRLLSQAVKGIGDYGNALGIAVGGGELFFDNSFSVNPLVNAMTVGVIEKGKITSATTGGVIGAKVYIVGATTGRDGIHGATFASQDLSQESQSQRSAVQVGDPFMEKLLMEATLEIIEKKLIIGIQDMGAAGLSCATSEMSARGKTGMKVNLDLVPFRETGMNAYEAMLSESQERMLVVAIPGKENDLKAIFEKWDLHCVEIGEVTQSKNIQIFKDGELKAEIPAESLVLGGGAPRYKRDTKKPAYLEAKNQLDTKIIDDIIINKSAEDTIAFLKNFLSSPNIASRLPLYRQYDTEVGLVKVIEPGADGGLVRVPNTNRGIAVSTDCNSRYTYLDPYQGAIWAVCESARNVAVTGAEPWGVTNNLNFGNPYIPENYWVFSECIRGMGDACRSLGLPVTGGNVSFYNESKDGPVFPTPTIGMVGYLPDLNERISPFPKLEKIKIAMIGKFNPTIGGSEFLSFAHGKTEGPIPKIDCKIEASLYQFLRKSGSKKLLHFAKDLSLGGLLVGLIKIGFGSKLGIKVNALPEIPRRDVLYFGETSSTVLVGISPGKEAQIETLVSDFQLDFLLIGETQKKWEITMPDLELHLESLYKSWLGGLNVVFGED